jgi:hypothetical protein
VFALENGKLARRRVTLGLADDQSGLVEVRAGLGDGTQVISSRIDGLKAGASAVVKTPASSSVAGEPATKG